MRRTYKSKKDTGGGLEHKDVLQALDDKSSVFDAFYIQNIKQTKRELSCMGSSNHHGIPSNKVRKRKYVRRIIKEVEPPPKESLSESVFLTPDKSIRVNKAPDIFDQLLNSSPVSAEPKQSRKDDLFDRLLQDRPLKTYAEKKSTKSKKYSYCDSSTDFDQESDKENTSKLSIKAQNVTDIHTHELVIEKELKPKLDDSITNIVKKISLLNNFNRKSSVGSLKKTFRYNKNRLTKNLQSPSLKNSPLSSTPISYKQRSKSIYKFSPIPMGDMEESPSYVTITEKDENTSKNVSFGHLVNDNVIEMDQNPNIQSPLTHLQKKRTKSKISINKSIYSKLVTNFQPNMSEDSDKIKNRINITEEITYKNYSNNDKSTFQTSEAEPFKGFSDNTLTKNTEDNVVLKGLVKDNSITSTLVTKASCKLSNETGAHSCDEETGKDDSVLDCFTVEGTIPSQPFLGFTNVETETEEKDLSLVFSVKNVKSSQKLIKSDNVKTDITSNESNVSNSLVELTVPSQVFLGFTKIDADINISSENVQHKSKSTNCDLSNASNDTSLESQDIERESLYDTCSSERSSINEGKQPIVFIERMNNSLFQKYYEKMADNANDSKSTNESQSTANYKSFESSISEESVNEQDCIEDDQDYIPSDTSKSLGSAETDLSSSEDGENDLENDEQDNTIMTDNNKIPKDDRCVSFVTTRRRNEATNNSSIFVLDDSYASSTSTDCDKTIITKHKAVSNDETECGFATSEPMTIINESDNTEGRLSTTSSCANLKNSTDATRISFVTTRKSSKMFTENLQHPENSKPLTLERPGIVLQPGKKWERSLSIYRRMTMMTDHFDQSILEDEDLHTKGRKYRQSVISTMELQESKGSLHNESFSSRRSTFLSKPSRSTIRIVKEPNSRISIGSTTVIDDLKGFLEDCDDTVIELSKLSIADSEHEITVLEKFHDSSRATPARDYVLRRCNQTDTLLFDECYPDAALKNCRKIGEGVYGEVFLWRAPDGRARVMKIVPIAGTTKVNGEHQKDFHEIISEIVIAMELSALRAPIAEIERRFDEGEDIDELDLHSVENATDIFNEVLAVRCVYGSYPSRLLDLWELYDECKGSENDNPAILPVDQQYIVLELSNAGQDLESYHFNSAEQAHALFMQVAFGLAVGEEAYQFEHRDLHWGNVLIAPTEQKYATFVLRGRAHRVCRRGVAATIIDYSLSRLSLPLAARDSAALYNDLAADEGLFGALGDYQFEVYRLMRDKLGNDWKNFEPYTNILWLHYIADKMITALRYKRTNTKTHKQYIAKLKGIKNRILSYGSAVQFVLTDNEY